MVSAQYTHPDRRSLTAKVHAWLLPLKVFFLLVLLVISILLVLRHKAIQQHYQAAMARIEFSVIIGTAAVLLFPLMSQAFVQSSEVLFGISGRGTFSRLMPVLSLAFGAWTLLMVLFFYRRRDKELEAFGKMGSALGGAIAILKYTLVTALFVRLLGSGASIYTIAALLIVSVLGVIVLLRPPRQAMRSPSATNPGG